MCVTPVGFILFPLAICLLWQASRIARYNMHYIELNAVYSGLKRKDAFYADCDDAKKFLLGRKKIIYRSGLFILASLITFFCFAFFTIKTPNSSYNSPAWVVALFVLVYYGSAISFQFMIPLLDLKRLESDEEDLLKLNNSDK